MVVSSLRASTTNYIPTSLPMVTHTHLLASLARLTLIGLDYVVISDMFHFTEKQGPCIAMEASGEGSTGICLTRWLIALGVHPYKNKFVPTPLS